MAPAPQTTQPDMLWTVVRAAGTVDLILLTAAVVLGVAVLAKVPYGGAPRAVFLLVHRNISLLSVALLVAHVLAAVLLLHLGVFRALIPFTSHVRRFYLGLGVLSADLMVLLAATSVVRVRLSLRQWRQLHWAAYPTWAAAVIHGAAPGTDRLVSWVGWLDVLCVAAVLSATCLRFAQVAPRRPTMLMGVGAAAAFTVVGFTTWVHIGQPHASPSNRVTLPIRSTTETQR